MLQVKGVCKTYRTGALVQTALDKVSLNLRDNEFVAILGPSGSGKTTLLNVIGGLDRYDSGELVINGISTRNYTDRDWDSYRNHTVGFVFQSYNLIAHQSILANVELALTISGIRRAERRSRAKTALEQVGLGDQLHKKPNQLSGGQMQRVAIARALVNDPDILLADEPTGALDTTTSLQVMELLKQVAKDRLVVMVTHNPELAKQYATRIVKLHDGSITDDSDPYPVDASQLAPVKHENMGRASMSMRTALSLSFDNLRTKKGRTILTAFAGSIGIIGIALILSLSTGVNDYINDIQKSTMTSYPVSIQSQSFDFASLMLSGREARKQVENARDGVYTDSRELELASGVTASIDKNNLTAFKQYLDDPDSEIHAYIGENGIVYSYDNRFAVYAYDADGTLVNTDGSTLTADSSRLGQLEQANPMLRMMDMMGASANPNFTQLLPAKDGKSISAVVTDSYELTYGGWPAAYDETVLVLDANNECSAVTLYELGLLPAAEYAALMEKIDTGEKLTLQPQRLSYEQVCAQTLYLIPACDTYAENADGSFAPLGQTQAEQEKLLEQAIPLKIVGVVRPRADTDAVQIDAAVGYSPLLTQQLMSYTDNSAVVRAQRADKDVNVLNGLHFQPADEAQKLEDARHYLSTLGISEKALVAKQLLLPAYADDPMMSAALLAMNEQELAQQLDDSLPGMDAAALLGFYDSADPAGSYDETLALLGVVSPEAPSSIDLYADSFEDKDEIAACIERYNSTASDEDAISYTDYVGLIISSVTEIINVISYVLIAFVAVSLVVSSIMIGIITYISVLERTKEIGILRAIGASRRNVSQVFNAETFIIGLISGLMGVGITLLLLIPVNLLIHELAGTAEINAALPAGAALVLIALSMLLTLIGGLIPSRKASKKDPVTALRTE